jgi:hypothetical protein
MRRRDRMRQNLKRACRHRNALMQLVDIIVHKLKINTCWEDYYRFGLYRQDLSWEERSLYVGYFGSRYWPWDGNSLKFDRLFQLKSLQKSILSGHGIPTPRLLAKVGTDYAIDSPGKLQSTMSAFNEPFVTKFDGGGSGVGIYCLQRAGNKFQYQGETVDAEWVWQKYASVIDRGFLIEARAENHPDLDTIYPDSLNTMRLTTAKTADGLWHVLLPYVKFGRNGSQVDNMSAGGLFAKIDDTGRIGTIYCAKTGDEFERHPDTNAPVTGTTIPYFEEAKQLALDASQVYGFISTVAWDVGITPDGPVIIEGNPFWDPQGVQDKLGPFLTPEVAAGLPSRSWWTPWDRTHMFPNYMNYADGGWWQRWLTARRMRKNEELRLRSPGKLD